MFGRESVLTQINRAYYVRPTSSTSIPESRRESHPSTSANNISLNIFRPRNRQEAESGQFQRRSSLAISPIRPRELDLVEVGGSPRRRISPSWSPHLWHDKASLGRRRTIFIAPSIDEQAEGKALTKRKAQIILFAFGFLLPPG